MSDKPIVREISQGWNVNVSFAADGSVVELVILDAVKEGFMPFESAGKPACSATISEQHIISANPSALSGFTAPARLPS